MHFLALGDERGDQRSEFIGDVAVGWQLKDWLQLQAEINYGHASATRGNGSVHYAATIGAIMNVTDSVRIDVGLQGVVLGRNADNASVWIANFSKSF